MSGCYPLSCLVMKSPIEKSLNTSDFDYFLPPELIAQETLPERTASRLLVLGENEKKQESVNLEDRLFKDIVDLVEPEDLLVFNNTRVIPARLYGKKDSGGKVEVMVERVLDKNRVLAHVRANKSPKPGSLLYLEDGALQAEVLKRRDTLFEIGFAAEKEVLELLDKHGHIPLPPYIERADTEEDRQRYQTVFAEKPGAVAAPTAGLHFSDELLQTLKNKGVKMAQVTLHVGAGTFQPVRVDNLDEHVMHAEWLDVSQSVCDAITACKERGGKVVAVGTTTVRSLESAAKAGRGELRPFRGDTRLFITPGFRFNVVDAMITNFHLPQSTLLMLVSAFSGYQNIMAAYRYAVEKKYRFFSYGDAMFLKRQVENERE